MCTLGTNQKVPSFWFKVGFHNRNFYAKVGKPRKPFKFQDLIWQARLILYKNLKKKKTENRWFITFRAT